MNKVVKKLFEAAGGTVEICDVTRDEIWTYSDDLDPEKFAELLIQECFEFLDDDTESKIRKHFGLL